MITLAPTPWCEDNTQKCCSALCDFRVSRNCCTEKRRSRPPQCDGTLHQQNLQAHKPLLEDFLLERGSMQFRVSWREGTTTSPPCTEPDPSASVADRLDGTWDLGRQGASLPVRSFRNGLGFTGTVAMDRQSSASSEPPREERTQAPNLSWDGRNLS